MSEQEQSKFGFQYLAGKALYDPGFVRALMDNPEQALQDIGITPTPELLEAIQGVDLESIMAVARAFETGPDVRQI